jgi:hypothetical protein
MSHLAPPAPPVKRIQILRAGVAPPWLTAVSTVSDSNGGYSGGDTAVTPTMPLAALRMAASTAYREQAIKAEQIGPGTTGVRNTGKVIFKFTTTGKTLPLVSASSVDLSLPQPPAQTQIPLLEYSSLQQQPVQTQTPLDHSSLHQQPTTHSTTPPLPLSAEPLDILDEQAITDARERASSSLALRRRDTDVPVTGGGAHCFTLLSMQ